MLQLSKAAATTSFGHGAKPAATGHLNARRAYHNGQLNASATHGISVWLAVCCIQQAVVVSRAPLPRRMAQVFVDRRTHRVKKNVAPG